MNDTKDKVDSHTIERPINVANIKTIRYTTWAFLALSAALLVTLGIITWLNYSRETEMMRYHYTHEGLTLIATLEASVQIGIEDKKWDFPEVEELLHRSVSGPNISYIALVDSVGRVLFDTRRDASDVVLSAFRKPDFTRPVLTSLRERTDGLALLQITKKCAVLATEIEHYIVMGMNMGEMREAQTEDVRRALMSAAILLILASGTFYFFFLIRKYANMSETVLEMEIYKRDMIESIPIGLISLDQSGHIETFNRVAAKLLGLDAESAIGKKLQEVLNCDLELLLKPVSETHEFTTDCQRSDGTVIPVSLTFSRVTGSNGNDLGSLFIIRDMRQIASLERRVERSERLASLGRMAAGIAHEVRNPLSSIKGFAQYFRDMFEVGSPDYENAALMVKEADRLNRVIEELLHFARPLELEIQMIQLNPVISHAVRLISSDIHSRNIGLRVDIAATESLRILADNDKFIQVLLNLMINSLDSIEVEGELTISTAVREDDVLIEIKDTGRGIASENIQRIFDPFYTTKKDGTGLGLAIVYRIIEQMKGDIKVQSSQNEGTSFFIMFDKM